MIFLNGVESDHRSDQLTAIIVITTFPRACPSPNTEALRRPYSTNARDHPDKKHRDKPVADTITEFQSLLAIANHLILSPNLHEQDYLIHNPISAHNFPRCEGDDIRIRVARHALQS